MQKLSKKERHEAYKKALANIQPAFGICHYLDYKNGHSISPNKLEEFCLFTPTKKWLFKRQYFFNRIESSGYGYKLKVCDNRPKAQLAREIILDFCILMTKPNGKKC